MFEIFFYCLPFGVVSGVISGLLGVGGGIIIVPFLAWLLSHHGMPSETIMQTAVATSLATIIVTSGSAVLAQQRRRTIDWKIVNTLAPGIAVGAWFGADLAHLLSSQMLANIFGLFLLISGINTALNLKPKAHRQIPKKLVLSIAGTFIGAISTLVGIGGGTLTVPYMSWHNIPMKKAVAIGSACAIPIAIFGSFSFIIIGLQADALPTGNIGYINLPAFFGISASSLFATTLGVHLAHRLSTHTLKRVFAVILILVGLSMLFN